jgi:RNA 2',3'-cyclic 3'-phosphodiesterase
MLDKTRSFICIDFPSDIVKEITKIQELMSKKLFSHAKVTAKLIEPENLHLTLKFLGHISHENLNKVKKCLSKVSFSQPNLKLDKIGSFNYKGKPKIIWIKITRGIFDLQKQIDESLSTLFPKEQRFMSHLTIARIKQVKNLSGFYEYLSSIKPSNRTFKCNSFKLKASILKSPGPIYKTIKEYILNQ